MANRLESTTRLPQPADALGEFLSHVDVPAEVREFFARRPGSGAAAAASQTTASDADSGNAPDGQDETAEDAGNEAAAPRVLAGLPIAERLKIAVKGTREQLRRKEEAQLLIQRLMRVRKFLTDIQEVL